MSDQAKVASIDALETFRADLIQYLKKALVAAENITSEVKRTQTWLDTDRQKHWSREHKKRAALLQQAQQELYSANLISPLASNALQKNAVARAKRSLEEAEEKLRVLRHWQKNFDHRANPLVRQLDPLFAILGQSLPKGVVSLGESIRALQAYAEKIPAPPAKPAGNETEAKP